MRALVLTVLLGCASKPALAPLPMEDCSVCSWANVVRMNREAIAAYDRGDFDGAAERFINVNARGMSARGFFNICLAQYRADEKAPDPRKLESACQACAAAFTVEDMQLGEVRPRLQRLLAAIDATAKRRQLTLTCDRSAVR